MEDNWKRLQREVINKDMMIDFKPVIQNGRTERVKYKLTILFK